LAGERHKRDRRVLPPGSCGARGVVPPGSQAGQAAVAIARQTAGVKRVETYFVPSRPSWESDIAIKEQIRANLIADPALISAGVDIAVFAGHVVLVGVVDSRECPEVHFRRALGAWRRIRNLLHPDDLDDCKGRQQTRSRI